MKKGVFTAVCCMAMLAGCQQAEEIENLSEKLSVTVEASIGKLNASSRYSGNTPNEVEFANGDKIGLSVNGGTFVEWSYDGASWSPGNDGVFWGDKDNDHKFVAFYPYASITSSGSIPMPSLSGQNGTMSSVSTRDFLMATKIQSYGSDGVVSFSGDNAFNHISSLVTVNLKGEGELASATIIGISISGADILTPSNYLLGDNPGVVINTVESERVNVLEISLTHTVTSGNNTFYFILNSNTVELQDVALSIKYKKTGDTEYIATLNGLGTSDVAYFESGKQYSYSLKVTNGVLVVSGNTITDWGDGLSLEDIVINGSVNQNADGGNDEDA